MNIKIITVKDLSTIYKTYMLKEISKDDYPDGLYFRKNKVYVVSAYKILHTVFYPEGKIITGLTDFLNIYNKKKINVWERALISHIMFETIHPFYDGNGRFGRLLMSSIIFNETKSITSYLISQSFYLNINKYYKSFDLVNNKANYPIINESIKILLDILYVELINFYNNI